MKQVEAKRQVYGVGLDQVKVPAVTHRKKLHLNLRNCFLNFISSIRDKETFKTIFFCSKYNTGKNLRNNLFNFIALNKQKFFFKLKKIFF